MHSSVRYGRKGERSVGGGRGRKEEGEKERRDGRKGNVVVN